jgi:porphobilinogen synthase
MCANSPQSDIDRTRPTALAMRPRRMRSGPAIRRLAAEVAITSDQLVQPMFVVEGLGEPRPVPSMPGVVQHTLESLGDAVGSAASAGLGGVMLFGVPEHRDECGSAADDPAGILNQAVAAARRVAGDSLVVMADLCLDEFTDHGHCGLLTSDGVVDNDATLERYCSIAVSQARAGAQMLGLSGMMDGQVAAVRSALDESGHTDVALLAYAAKYASAWYGPFRDAVDSNLQGDRRTYQQDPANRREALLEAQLDEAQGADVLMVKPAMGYLDVLSDVSAQSKVPVWAYQVSGEYAAIEAAAAQGWLERDALIVESVLGIRRAGADVVLTYWATELAERLMS